MEYQRQVTQLTFCFDFLLFDSITKFDILSIDIYMCYINIELKFSSLIIYVTVEVGYFYYRELVLGCILSTDQSG